MIYLILAGVLAWLVFSSIVAFFTTYPYDPFWIGFVGMQIVLLGFAAIAGLVWLLVWLISTGMATL